MKEAARAAFPAASIEFTNVNRAGWHATVIRTASEAIRKQVTDSRLSAKLEFKNVTYFTIAPLGPYAGNPSLAVKAVERAYATTCWMSNPAGHTAGLFMSLWSLVSLCACIYVPLLMSVTTASIHLMNVILVTYV